MKNTLLLLLSLFPMVMNAQQKLSVDQVKSQWQTRNLKVEVDKPTILQLVQTFQNAFPTYSGGELIKFSKSKTPYDNTDKVVDIKNGYVLYSEDDPDSDNDEQLQACVWRRSNGHSLFAVNLHRFSNEVDVLCFYDFNPQTKTLTPEKSLTQLFTPSFSGYRYRVWLPQNGKNLKVEEFFGALTILHSYSWDGNRPVNPKVSISNFDSYQATFAEKVFFAEEHPLTQYALIDVDKDGVPELWLSSDDQTYQAVFAVKLTMDYVGGQDDRTTLSFYKGAVCTSGHCGAGCMSSIYRTVKESSYGSTLMDIQEYDNAIDDYGPSQFTLDGEEITESKGQAFIRKLGDEITFNPRWKKLYLDEE